MKSLMGLVIGGMLVVSVSVCAPGRVQADETGAPPEAVLNNPSPIVEAVKRAVNVLNPSYETLWDWKNGGFSQSVSASLYTFKSNGLNVGSARVGVSTDSAIYAGASLDLPSLSKRFVPQTIKGIATTAPLDVVWALVGKYARVGVVAGYSWEHDGPVIGATLGAAVSF